jgi:hypothetical protein
MHRPRCLALATHIAAGSMPFWSLAACGGSVSDLPSTPDAGESTALATGNVSVEIQLTAGSLISMASYALTGPHSFHRSLSVDFAATSQVDFGIDQVPASDGYNLDVTLTSPDGANVCTSSGQFGVDESMTATVVLIPHCSQPAAPPAATAVLQLTVDLPTGVSITNLAFSLLGANGFRIQDAWIVANDSALLFVVQNIPAGKGDYLSLSAMSRDGVLLCSAASTINFESNSTTEATLVLQCASVAAAGDL